MISRFILATSQLVLYGCSKEKIDVDVLGGSERVIVLKAEHQHKQSSVNIGIITGADPKRRAQTQSQEPVSSNDQAIARLKI